MLQATCNVHVSSHACFHPMLQHQQPTGTCLPAKCLRCTSTYADSQLNMSPLVANAEISPVELLGTQLFEQVFTQAPHALSPC